jgi:hypothetical protein
MTASLNLFRLEVRRSTGLLLFPLLVGLAWAASTFWLGIDDQRVTLWTQTSAKIGVAVLLLGPAAGGLAAWAAGRERRRRIEELLATTPFPSTRRDLANWAGSAAWTMLAYAVSGVWFVTIAVREATWGGPRWWPILLGAIAVLAYGAIGFAFGAYVGRYLPSSLAAALVPIVLMVAQVLPGTSSSQSIRDGITFTEDPASQHLTALELMPDTAGEIFMKPPHQLSAAAAIWLLGLCALGLTVAALRRERAARTWAALGVTAAVVVGSAGTLLATDAPTPETIEFVAYEPVCVERTIPVCVHPAYDAALDESADVVDRLVRPLSGVPGAPIRAEQRPGGDRSLPEGTMGFDFIDAEADLAGQGWRLARELVTSPASPTQEFGPAQAAVALWLARQAGLNDQLDSGFWLTTEPLRLHSKPRSLRPLIALRCSRRPSSTPGSSRISRRCE